ncbi:hypothetical protein [Leptodesmis sichuanensis]|uniref:hypothetical protein n=1 Tax=Leptodesmis sichuanensis TaxID=2906798 RepID=UPI001F1E682B|nr:hypothetical protein [Leptodesmis sichuanensis]UIE37909.1 hypothetical protein KIK02_23875 [Leptodesmis sichuanensis A121]
MIAAFGGCIHEVRSPIKNHGWCLRSRCCKNKRWGVRSPTEASKDESRLRSQTNDRIDGSRLRSHCKKQLRGGAIAPETSRDESWLRSRAKITVLRVRCEKDGFEERQQKLRKDRICTMIGAE